MRLSVRPGLRLDNGWTGGRYSVFRGLLGLYLVVHFLQLLPWRTEVFSNRGMLPEASASPLYPLFPNVLFLYDAPPVVGALLISGAVLGVLLAIGHRDRLAAIGLWYVWACLLSRNPLISNPSLPFVGWMLLAHACLPRAPYGSLEGRRSPAAAADWRFPGEIFAAAWIVMAVAYSYSGLTKLVSPSWVDGSALGQVLLNPLARPTFLRELMLTFPDALLRLATWGALALEIAFAPLALVPRLRPLLWGAMVSMHLGLFALVDFPDLSIGMLLLHGFTFDPGWLSRRDRIDADAR